MKGINLGALVIFLIVFNFVSADVNDFDEFQTCWLAIVEDSPDCASSDFDGDGAVGFQDFNNLKDALFKYDLNADGVITYEPNASSDFDVFQSCWLTLIEDFPDCATSDFDDDGAVGFQDFNYFKDALSKYDLNGDGIVSYGDEEPLVECADSDGGLEYSEKGIASKEGSGSTEDFCVNEVKLSEALCNNDGSPAYAQYECPNGCSDGECLPAGEIVCSENSDCGDQASKTEYYCSDQGNPCYAVSNPPICQNPGTVDSVCTSSSGGGACGSVCPYGCEDGLCKNETSEFCEEIILRAEIYEDGGRNLVIIQRYLEDSYWADICDNRVAGDVCHINSVDVAIEEIVRVPGGEESVRLAIANPEGGHGYQFNYKILKNDSVLAVLDKYSMVFYEKDENRNSLDYSVMMKSANCPDEEMVCTDSDGGIEYYTAGDVWSKGHVSADGEAYISNNSFGEGDECCDSCDFTENINEGIYLREGYCDKKGIVQFEKYKCPNGCENGACLKINPTEETGPIVISGTVENTEEFSSDLCLGCILNDKCYPMGYRTEGEYCSDNLEFNAVSIGGEFCSNNFECESNVCVSGECVSEGLIRRIINWFKAIFS